jgi:TonB family protein
MKTKALLSLLFASALIFSVGEAASPAGAPSNGVAKVAHIKGMDKMPEVVTRVAPVYPRALRESGVQGVATVDMLIDSTGRVIEAKAVRATTPEFAAEAVEAAKAWVFKPAEAAGHKITARVQVPFEFVMPQVAALEGRRK